GFLRLSPERAGPLEGGLYGAGAPDVPRNGGRGRSANGAFASALHASLTLLETLTGGVGSFPAPGGRRWRNRAHDDAVHRAGRQAQAAARAQIADDGVHGSWAAGYGVHGTGLYAQRAAYAQVFLDGCDLPLPLDAVCRIERLVGLLQ